MAYEKFVKALLQTMKFEVPRSRLSMAGVEVAFHCDKFNTRILKNFEDVMGYEQGMRLIREAAERTSYDLLKSFFSQGTSGPDLFELPMKQRIEAILELYKVFAYGALTIEELTEKGARLSSATSYLAEGWIENRERWHLDEREGPACHDICGHVAAAFAISANKPIGSFRVSETSCRAFKDSPVCQFKVEVAG